MERVSLKWNTLRLTKLIKKDGYSTQFYKKSDLHHSKNIVNFALRSAKKRHVI